MSKTFPLARAGVRGGEDSDGENPTRFFVAAGAPSSFHVEHAGFHLDRWMP